MSLYEERVQTQLAEALGRTKRSGKNHTWNCPYCEEEGLSPDSGMNLWVHLGKKCWQCFRCGRKGRLDTLLRFLGIEVSGEIKHVEDVKEYVSQPLFTWGRQGEQATAKSLSFATGLLADTFPLDPAKPSSRGALAYLEGRGFTWKMLAPYGLRYSFAGKYAGRIIIPCFERGECVYFTARTILPGEEWKYLNPPKEVVPIGRENVVFGVDNLRRGQPCIVVEGQLNAMMLGLNAVACLGKEISDAQLEKLLAAGCSEYICALDDDAWGKNVDLAKRISDRVETKVSVVTWPKGQDAVDLGPQDAIMAVLGRSKYGLATHLLGNVINVFGRRR